jgi:hypothetical protein
MNDPYAPSTDEDWITCSWRCNRCNVVRERGIGRYSFATPPAGIPIRYLDPDTRYLDPDTLTVSVP